MAQRFEISPLGAPVDLNHQFNAFDRYYAQTGHVIGVAYVFEHAIDIGALTASLQILLTHFPVLSGRIEAGFHRLKPTRESVQVEYIPSYPGAASDFARFGYASSACISTKRLEFVPEPTRRDVAKGRTGIMHVRLTTLDGGGCVLGVSVNHAVMDAVGFHLLMRYWSDVFTGRTPNPLSVTSSAYDFCESQTSRDLQKALAAFDGPKPLNLNTLPGRMINVLMIRALDGIRRRGTEMFYLPPDKIADIKACVQTESGLHWVSTNVAVSAHVLHAIMPLQLPKTVTTLGIGNVINFRPRVDLSSGGDTAPHTGNALYIMLNQLDPGCPVVDLSRGQIARHLHAAFAEMTEANIRKSLTLIQGCLENGYSYPGLNLFKPIMSVNNQTKFDVYAPTFGPTRPVRVLPQDVGDHIMMFPARSGGMEIYIRDFASAKRQKKLRREPWRTRVINTG